MCCLSPLMLAPDIGQGCTNPSEKAKQRTRSRCRRARDLSLSRVVPIAASITRDALHYYLCIKTVPHPGQTRFARGGFGRRTTGPSSASRGLLKRTIGRHHNALVELMPSHSEPHKGAGQAIQSQRTSRALLQRTSGPRVDRQAACRAREGGMCGDRKLLLLFAERYLLLYTSGRRRGHVCWSCMRQQAPQASHLLVLLVRETRVVLHLGKEGR